MDSTHVITRETERFYEVLSAVDPAARVPTCPDWDAADLAWHLAEVHHFWATLLRDGVTDAKRVGAIEEGLPGRPSEMAEIIAFGRDSVDELCAALSVASADTPLWTWSDSHQNAGFVHRWQPHEALMHRVDAELAAEAERTEIAVDLAAEGVGLVLDFVWQWGAPWMEYERHPGAVELRATDVKRTWRVALHHGSGVGPESGKFFSLVRAEHASDDDAVVATVSAPAEQLDLWAWGRGGSVSFAGEASTLGLIKKLQAQGVD